MACTKYFWAKSLTAKNIIANISDAKNNLAKRIGGD
jgi:hypothetical protein